MEAVGLVFVYLFIILWVMIPSPIYYILTSNNVLSALQTTELSMAVGCYTISRNLNSTDTRFPRENRKAPKA